MNGTAGSLGRSLWAMACSGRQPSRRAVAAAIKLCGWRPQRRWPFLTRAGPTDRNLGFDDLLALQFARARHFQALVVGAFDGTTNDPAGRFLLEHDCRAILVEPQPGPFQRLRETWKGHLGRVELVNAAIGAEAGSRPLYCIEPGTEGLPPWAEQVASFDLGHVLKHLEKLPGLERKVSARTVETLSFDDLLERYRVSFLDLLQIDAEGMDAQLLGWFPFERMRPGLLHYEATHMTPEEKPVVRRRLEALGYLVFESDSPADEMAISF